MSNPHPVSSPKPLRLWPGIVAVSLVWLLRFVVPILAPEATPFALMGSLACGLLVVVWWAFFSRVPHRERWGGLALMAAVVLLTRPLLDPSIAGGAMGMLFVILVIPTLSLALVLSAVLGRGRSPGVRGAIMAALLVLGSAGWALVRTGGFTSDFDSDFAWRWAPSPEEKLLAEQPAPPLAPSVASSSAGSSPVGTPVEPEPAPVAVAAEAAVAVDASAGEPASEQIAAAEPTAAGPAVVEPAPEAPRSADWPGFRGPARSGVVEGVRLATDWAASPPVELWRKSVGPGWSSFAVDGDLFYTQEQRGEEEAVSCYRLSTGEPVWMHRDGVRFWESNAGAGPRGTPTLSGGRIYALGATGLVNVLDAATGAVVWSRDAAADTGASLPIWGFSGSPLVLDDLVVVAASGALIAYDIESGEPRWKGPVEGEGYSSPHRVSLGGVEQILWLTGAGLSSVSPADGTVLWQHAWKGYPIVQPAVTPAGDVLISVSADGGLRRLSLASGPEGWSATERWTSRGLKPYFSDFVVHEGHAYGFDGTMLSCIDLEAGERKWKGGRYGNGQLVLLPEIDALLVLGERGDIALVAATPAQFEELARAPAIEGKTWNHPVVVGDVLLVRNGEEMAGFRLATVAPQVAARRGGN